MDLYDEIYYSLTGELLPGAALPWVENAFALGKPCDAACSQLIRARDRILIKLDVEEDPDLEEMLREMETIQHTLCRCLLQLRLAK